MKDPWIESGTLGAALDFLGPASPYRGLIMAAATIVVLLYLRRRLGRQLRGYVEARAQKDVNVRLFMRVFHAAWIVGMAILVVVAAGGSFRALGLSVAFFGTMLGWSLQVPVRGVAAWFMVLLKRPFRVGDRVQVAGVTGDVVDIQLNHIVLNQVGGTVSGEERSGRGIYVPTAMLFGETILNYDFFGTQESLAPTTSKFMLDEVIVRLPFEADYDFAREVCAQAAAQAVLELIGETDEAPFTRAEFLVWGVLLRVRYKTVPARRQEVSSRVTELIWQAFRKHADRVRFGVPVEGILVDPTADAPPPRER